MRLIGGGIGLSVSSIFILTGSGSLIVTIGSLRLDLMSSSSVCFKPFVGFNAPVDGFVPFWTAIVTPFFGVNCKVSSAGTLNVRFQILNLLCQLNKLNTKYVFKFNILTALYV